MQDAQQLQNLIAQLQRADGPDVALDQAIARGLDGRAPAPTAPAYTASVDRCLELRHRLLPLWHWHIGYSATGLLPYAVVSNGPDRFEATAPTVPLALLLAVAKARLALEAKAGPG